MHSSSAVYASRICDRRCVVAGSVNTVWAVKLSSSPTNCSSFSLGLSVGARESASTVNWCFIGTYLTVTLNLINRRRNRWIRGGGCLGELGSVE